MATATTPRQSTDPHAADYGSGAGSREIEQDINRTRDEMDETLHELGDRLHPRHLFDDVLDLFRSSGSSGGQSEYTQQARRVGRRIASEVKKHPLPALMAGAGIAWLLVEEFADVDERQMLSQQGDWRNLDSHSGSYVDARTGEPYEHSYGREWSRAAAWDEGYDWSESGEDEESWNERANEALQGIQSSLSETGTSARDKMRHVSAKLMAVSGRKRSDIHSRWSSLREHSGSFVDARTGKPYDENYGREWERLAAVDHLASKEWTPEEEQQWNEKSQDVLNKLQKSLSQSGGNAKDKLRGAASTVGEYVQSTRGVAVDYASAAGERTSAAARSTRDRSVELGRKAGRGVQDGAVYARDRFSEAVEDYPLAVGAACLGLGLIAGLALPGTRYEDRWMGETSEQLKGQAKAKGHEAVQRGQDVAEATGSAAMDELERQGLTPQQIAEKAEGVAEKVTETVQEETGTADDLKDKVERVAEKTTETAKQKTKEESQELAGKPKG